MATVWKYKRWIVAAGLLLVFLLFAFNLNSLGPFDQAIYGAVSLLQCGLATRLFRGMTLLVHPVVLLAVSLALIYLVHQRAYTVPIFMNLALSVLLNLGLKSIFTRPRPVNVVRFVTETGYSFPSGHSMAAATFYGFVIYLVRQSGLSRAKKNALTALLVGMILLVGTSRVYLGAHYGSDVIAAFCVSTAYLIVFTSFVTTYFREGRSLAPEKSMARKNDSLLISFAHALDGVIAGLKAERNMLIHFGVMSMVIVFGVILNISAAEWIVCVMLFALVMAMELVNTAIEAAVDLCTQEYDPKAKLAKDTAAGAVLVAAIGAAVVGCIIFMPKIIGIIQAELR